VTAQQIKQEINLQNFQNKKQDHVNADIIIFNTHIRNSSVAFAQGGLPENCRTPITTPLDGVESYQS